MYELINQLMQSQMPQQAQQQSGPGQTTLGKLFGSPEVANAHLPIEMPAPPPSMSLKKLNPGFAKTKEGQAQYSDQINQIKVAPEDEMFLQAQGKRLMGAMARLKA